MAQFLLTVVIVLGLIGAVWWFIRRYSGVHFGGIGRGRVPRLAIVDAMPSTAAAGWCWCGATTSSICC